MGETHLELLQKWYLIGLFEWPGYPLFEWGLAMRALSGPPDLIIDRPHK